MNFNMKIRSICFASILMVSAGAAFAAPEDTDSLEQEQKSLMDKLDSLNKAVLGLKLNGRVKGGALLSMASSDQFNDDSPTQENQAYTDVNLILTARPSSETEVRVEMRLHKDWQSAYDEGNNPVLGHWFSYDGTILNNKLAFNLGYMRVGFTPLTLYVPQTEFLQEPEIFAESRVEALEQRNLDTTSRRLLQGINADYHSGKVGVLDDIHVQAMGARLRNIAKKNDQAFFDFDWSDRYSYGGRLGVEAFGANVGVNYIGVFDREKSFSSHDLGIGDSVVLDDNKVFSGELGWNSSKLLPDLPVTFGVSGEFAMSWWDATLYTYQYADTTTSYRTRQGTYPNEDGGMDTLVYVQSNTSVSYKTVSEDWGDDDGTSFYIKPFVAGSFAGFNFNLTGMYLQNDEDFWSEMASASPYSSNTVILNSNGLYVDSVYSNLLVNFGMSSLENLYFSVYNSSALYQGNIMSSSVSNVLTASRTESSYTYSRLYNNYKSTHFYRNGYSADTKKRLEVDEATALMNPSINMALPYGLATPDRKGFAVSLDVDWTESVELNARFSQYNQDAIDNTYTTFGVGLGVDIGRIIGLDRQILIQGSYENASEDAYYERSSNRIMVGASIDVWGPIALLAGYQMVEQEYDVEMWVTDDAAITKASESLLLVGPRIKIAPASYISLQYGLLTDEVSFNRFVENVYDDEGNVVSKTTVGDKLGIDKNVFVADVTVTF